MNTPALDMNMETAPDERPPGGVANETLNDEDSDAIRIAEAVRERQARQVAKNIRVVAWSVPVTALVMAVSAGTGYDIFGGLLFAVGLAAYARLLRRYHALSGQWRFY